MKKNNEPDISSLNECVDPRDEILYLEESGRMNVILTLTDKQYDDFIIRTPLLSMTNSSSFAEMSKDGNLSIDVYANLDERGTVVTCFMTVYDDVRTEINGEYTIPLLWTEKVAIATAVENVLHKDGTNLREFFANARGGEKI